MNDYVCDFIASKMFMTTTRIRKKVRSVFWFLKIGIGVNNEKNCPVSMVIVCRLHKITRYHIAKPSF